MHGPYALPGIGRAKRVNLHILEAASAAADWQAPDEVQAKQASLKTPKVYMQ